jgi:hypothetical protein
MLKLIHKAEDSIAILFVHICTLYSIIMVPEFQGLTLNCFRRETTFCALCREAGETRSSPENVEVHQLTCCNCQLAISFVARTFI